MLLRRRTLLLGGPAVVAAPAMAGGGAVAPIAEYERESGGHIGVYAENVATGARFAWRADERFVMCSTFKASLAALVLSRVDRGQDRLDDVVHYGAADIGEMWAPVAKAALRRGTLSVGEMCQAVVEISDGACANLLLRRVGGPAAMTGFWRAIGDGVSRLDHAEPVLNRTPAGGVADTTTPAAMAGTLRRLVLGPVLAAPSRALLTKWLIGCQTGGNRLRAGLPRGWVIGDKTGHNGADAAGDIAVAWADRRTAIVVCAYTRGGRPTEAQFDAVFAGVGRMVAAALG